MKYLFLLFLFASNWIFAQNPVDFKKVDAKIYIQPEKELVTGNLEFTFEVLQETDSIFIDAQNMNIEKVLLNGKKTAFHNNGNRLAFVSKLKPSKKNTLRFNYSASPKQTMYFIGWQDTLPKNQYSLQQVWTQGQGRETSHWLPSFNNANEKLVFNLTFNFKNGYTVISNGKLISKKTKNDTMTTWKYQMKNPMSSYLVAVAAGKYQHKEITSRDDTPIYLYYYSNRKNTVEPTYRYTQKIFSIITSETGVPFPWQNYKQIPVRDFLYSGMENTTSTIFSDIFITDSTGFKDRNYVMVNAHELAHQWFGDMVTAASDKHHWLQEGFATYFALLAQKEIFGENYFYWKLYEIAEQLKKRSDAGKGQAVMSEGSNSLTYYQKGAWALHVLKELVGEKAFRTGIKTYLQNYKFENVITRDFISEMEKASGQDLSGYVSKWLKQSAFQAHEALNSLKKSEFILNYLEIAALKKIPIQDKKERLLNALNFPVNDYIGQEVVYQLALVPPKQVFDLYQKAFDTKNIFVRQAIAVSLDSIPVALKKEYESLLQDNSYRTQEIALYNLWMNFPEDRGRYLEFMKGKTGFIDKNIKILWLALNLATPTYQPNTKQQVYDKLAEYTAANYPFYIRQNAFRYLFQLNAFNNTSLKSLLAATQHPTSRFKSFARDMVSQLTKNSEYRLRLMELKETLPPKQRQFLERQLDREKV